MNAAVQVVQQTVHSLLATTSLSSIDLGLGQKKKVFQLKKFPTGTSWFLACLPSLQEQDQAVVLEMPLSLASFLLLLHNSHPQP